MSDGAGSSAMASDDVSAGQARGRTARRLSGMSLARLATYAHHSQLGIVLVFITLVVFAAVFVDGFWARSNLVDIVRSQAFIGMVAVGLTFIVISGNFIDLAVPAMVAIAANAAIGFQDRSLALALATALLLPLGIGLTNGLLIAYRRANPVIVTLGTASIALGALYVVTNATYASSSRETIQTAATTRVATVPVQAIIFLALLLLGQLALTRTRLGPYVRATGANALAARVSGVPTRAITVGCFLISALTCSIAGIFLGGFRGQADLSTGTGYEFNALAAVVIGGSSLLGGTGSLWRTLLGVLLIGVTNNVMVLLGLPPSQQLFVLGLILILAVVTDTALARLSRGSP